MQVELKSRFPTIEVSYETDSNNTTLTSQYNICMAVPTGRKQLLWFTHEPNNYKEAAYLTDSAGTRFIEIQHTATTHKIAYGTIIAGTVTQICMNSSSADTDVNANYFIINDIYMYEGVSTSGMTFAERLHYIIKLLERAQSSQYYLCLPYMCAVVGSLELLHNPIFYDNVVNEAAYNTHHIQFRSTAHILPHLNHNYNKQFVSGADRRHQTPTINVEHIRRQDLDHKKALDLGQATFMVMADLQDDIYHLYAVNTDGKYIYIDIAFIATRADSVMLNTVFRNIRENTNVELGEESEDEDIFQNANIDKYVDLKKQILMNCLYSARWKKWIPIHVAANIDSCILLDKIIGINTEYNNKSIRLHNQRSQYKPHYKSHHNVQYKSQYKPHHKSLQKMFSDLTVEDA